MKENIEGQQQQQQQQTLQKSVIFRNRSRRKESEKECHQRPKANHTKDLERDDHPNKGPTSLQSLRGHGCTLHQKHQLLYKMGTFAQLVESINLKNNGDQRPTRRSLLVNPRFEQKLSQTAH